MQSLRGCYLGNLSGGEAESKTAGYRDEGNRQVGQTRSQALEKEREDVKWHVYLKAQMNK